MIICVFHTTTVTQKIMTALDPALQVIGDATTTAMQAGIDGVLSGFNASFGSIAALFGEEFEQDFVAQLDQFDISLDFNIKEIEFKAINLRTNVNINLKNIELEFDELTANLGVPSLEAIEPPQLGFIKWINSIGTYILIGAGIIALFILYDAYKINGLSNIRGTEQRIAMTNQL